MKRFLFTRFRKNHMGYGYYIEPEGIPETLDTVIRQDGDANRFPLHILFLDRGKVIIGLKYKLPPHMRDNGNRPVTAFVGYELEHGQPLPYFSAVKSKLDAIQQETLDAYVKIENGVDGKTLRDSSLRFDTKKDTGTAWDNVVNAFNRERHTNPRLFIGDASGQGEEIDLIKKSADIATKEDRLLRKPTRSLDIDNVSNRAEGTAKMGWTEPLSSNRNPSAKKKIVEESKVYLEKSSGSLGVFFLASGIIAVTLIGWWAYHHRSSSITQHDSSKINMKRNKTEIALKEYDAQTGRQQGRS